MQQLTKYIFQNLLQLLVVSELYVDTDSKDVTYGAPKPVGHACYAIEPEGCHVDDTTAHQQRSKDLNLNGWVYDCGLHRKMQGTRSRTKDGLNYYGFCFGLFSNYFCTI